MSPWLAGLATFGACWVAFAAWGIALNVTAWWRGRYTLPPVDYEPIRADETARTLAYIAEVEAAKALNDRRLLETVTRWRAEL